MKKAKYAVLAMMLAAALVLSGCRLALDEREYSRDKLVGISVRLGSSRSIFSDSQSGISRYEPHDPDGEVLRLNVYTDEAGVTFSDSEYDSDWFEPVHLHVHSKDEGTDYSLETTIYAAEDMLPDDPFLQIERVYEREDGTLYALAGGHNYSGSLDGLGLKISESHSKTDTNGKKSTSTTTIQLWVKYEEQVISAEAVEMKDTGAELARHQLTGQDEIWISPDAEWILIEETLADGSIRRSTVNAADRPYTGNRSLDRETFFVRIANEQGVCIRETYTIRTPGPLDGAANPG